MTLASGARPAPGAADFESDARQVAVRLERGKYFVLSLFTLVYATGAVLHARGKPLWFDEIITLIAASPADVATSLKAAQVVDASPPLPHLLTHFAVAWFGSGEIAVRLPAIVGFWIFCLCMFAFTRRLGIFYALVALLLPIATEAYSFAYEARAYGLELAFCGLALVCWQAAAGGSRRWMACAGISLSLIGALFCHYYAVLLYIPLAGAEAFRALRARRIDWPVWLAFAVGGAPVAWRFVTIARVVNSFGHGTWSPAYPEQVLEFWQTGLQHSLSFVVVGLAFMGMWMMRRRAPAAPESAPPTLAPHELLAAILFLAIPLVAVAAGLAFTHVFADRYVLPALAGAVILIAAMAARLSGGRAMAGFLLLCLAILPLAFVSIEVPAPRNPFENEPLLADALRKEPVVLSDGQLFLQMWQYAPASLRPNILFLADEAAATKYMGFDAIDGGLRVLTPWSSIHLLDYRDFAVPGREFVVYQTSLRPGWLMARVMADGATVSMQSFTNYRQLYRVKLP